MGNRSFVSGVRVSDWGFTAVVQGFGVRVRRLSVQDV